MVSSLATTQKPEADTAADFGAIVIGAGVSGLYPAFTSSTSCPSLA
jgi:cation diffusion facilitator CzcD-associated flavoprotein CzcO